MARRSNNHQLTGSGNNSVAALQSLNGGAFVPKISDKPSRYAVGVFEPITQYNLGTLGNPQFIVATV